MAIQGLMDARIFLGGYEYTSFSSSLTTDYAAEMLDNTVFGDDTRSNRGGVRTFAFTVGGYRDDGATTPFGDASGTAYARVGAAREVFSYAPVGTADGQRSFTIRGVNGTYTPLSGSVGDLLPFELTGAAAHSELIRGVVEGVGTKTATANSTGTNLGALSATQSLYAGLHVTAFGGTSPTLDVKIQSDDNSGFSSATDRITFTQNTGSIQAQWGSVNGAVSDTYWRSVMTIGGSTPTFTLYVTIGIGSLAIS
tara:strand:- start:4844 stop:5602 length:759 start_codon:yes stop_codon:yes gene_type:complete